MSRLRNRELEAMGNSGRACYSPRRRLPGPDRSDQEPSHYCRPMWAEASSFRSTGRPGISGYRRKPQKSSPNGSGLEVSERIVTSSLPLGVLAWLFGPPSVPRSYLVVPTPERKPCVSPLGRAAAPPIRPALLMPNAILNVPPNAPRSGHAIASRRRCGRI